MALTNEEKQELLNAMKAESQGVDELEQVDTLDLSLIHISMPPSYPLCLPPSIPPLTYPTPLSWFGSFHR